MITFTDERCRQLNELSPSKDARYVLYWMQLYKRTSHNHALNKAIEIANALEVPLVVYEGLKYYYPWASDRLHTFILEGVVGKKKVFAKMGIRYMFYLQPDEKAPNNVVAGLCQEAAALITDDFPSFIIPEHNRHITERIRIPVYAVDSNGMIPMRQFTKEEFAARTIRPKVHRLLPNYTTTLSTPVLKVKHPRLSVDAPETNVTNKNIAKLVAGCDIDHSVPPSDEYKGGEEAAMKRLRYFVKHILPGYHELRNKPQVDGCSRLSAYLHFGFISAQQIYKMVINADAPKEAKDAYLEELVVRRELAYNFVLFNGLYDSLEAAPAWAVKTMAKHRHDKRVATFTPEEIERGTTTDMLWNATQHELIKTGGLHNYMRMLWGKKIIEWMPDYTSAFDLMVNINNKYALDGRNPNSYTGIHWCFGKHDRAWGPERPVFGTLRYLSSASWWKKIDAKAYIRKYSGIDAGAPGKDGYK
jgi:deoxyribodipyrimidine photo-lyase